MADEKKTPAGGQPAGAEIPTKEEINPVDGEPMFFPNEEEE